MKKLHILITLLIICLIVMAIFSGTSVLSIGVGTYEHADQYRAGDTTVTSAVENLEVDWTEGALNIVFHEGSGIAVSETAKKTLTDDTRLHWWLDGATLRIHYAKSGLIINENLEKKLTISLPEGLVLNKADIGGTSADIIISALAADDMILGSTSGDIRALVAAKKLNASSTSGSLDITQRGGSDSVTLHSTSGSVNASLEDVKVISLSSTSGSVTLIQAGEAESVTLHSTSGSVRAENVNARKADAASTSGSVTVLMDALYDLHVSSTSGTVTATLPATPGFTCKVSTASGSFNSAIALNKDGDTYSCGDGSGSVKLETASGNIRILEKK